MAGAPRLTDYCDIMRSCLTHGARTMAQLVGATEGKVLWIYRLHVLVIFYFFFFPMHLLRAAAEATRRAHLHIINVKGALNV